MSSSRVGVKTRSGCQNCRTRHLKCDDLQPSCARCEKAGLHCDREYKIRFRHEANPSINAGGSTKRGLDFGKSQPWVKTASSLTFLDGTRHLKSSVESGNKRPRALSASPPTSHPSHLHSTSSLTMDDALQADEGSSKAQTRPERASHSPHASVASASLHESFGSPLDHWHYSNHTDLISSPTTHINTRSPDQASVTGIPHEYLTFSPSREGLTRNMSRDSYAAAAGSTTASTSASGIYLETSVWPIESREEAALLRYYVQRLARNFDLSDPLRHFRTVVPQRAATCPLLLNAIYALSARHLSRVGDYDPLVSDRYHQECLKHVIPILDDPEAILDENLLASAVILRHLEEFEEPLSGCSPADRQSHLIGSHALIKAQGPAAMSEGLRQAAFWVCLRQEIYVAFINQRSVAIAHEDLNLDRSLDAATDHIWSCRMVALCADTIRFCFGEDDKPMSGYERLSLAVQQWHSSKSESFTPIYHKEADEENLLPDIWFLSDEVTIGLQHYYIAKLLLCAHNPRMPRLGPGRASALRAMDDEIKDYVRVLCGIAMSNPDTAPNFTYAFMSVVAAGDKFTERSEQEALLNVLNICDSQYAFPTGHARENLKAAWGWTQEIG